MKATQNNFNILKAQPTIKAYPSGEVFVSCCCYCYRKESQLYKAFPFVEGMKLSHGFCSFHAKLVFGVENV